MGPEIITALGTALAGIVGAFVGGKNSLNGFKARVDTRFDAVDAGFTRVEGKVDALVKTDGVHEARLALIEKHLEEGEKAALDDADALL